MVMHRSLTSARAAALPLFLLVALTQSPATYAEADGPASVAALEAALPGAPAADRPALLERLRQAYAEAARQAESKGNTREAEEYRDNLEILNRKPRVKTATPPAPAPQPEPKAPEPAPRPEAKAPEPVTPKPPPDPDTEPVPASSLPVPTPMNEPPPLAAPVAAPKALKARSAEIAIPSRTAAPEPKDDVESRLKTADTAFRAERYDEAGRIYAALAQEKSLPDKRRGHWAYCRAVEVVRKINARPASAQEWAAIDAEIQKIRVLSPTNWFGEYLRNLASERGRDPRARASQSSNKLTLRGASPEEPAPPQQPPAPQPAQAAGPATQIPWSRQPVQTANFLVTHLDRDRELAERVAQAAEAARDSQVKRWGAVIASGTWSPRCEIVLFPTAKDFARETLQPAESPGFSTMGMNGGRIILRRVHLRVDHPNMVKAILPHEVTHVVLADLFPQQQIPRWADEGMAVLAEPKTEQAIRAADLDDPLKTGRLFTLKDLTAMDYPEPKHWALYYAQSVSLTRYLVETGSPAMFVRLVQESQQKGFETALREIYAVSDFQELQTRWSAYARERTDAEVAVNASSDEPEKNADTSRR